MAGTGRGRSGAAKAGAAERDAALRPAHQACSFVGPLAALAGADKSGRLLLEPSYIVPRALPRLYGLNAVSNPGKK